jgi:hypothetical protein
MALAQVTFSSNIAADASTHLVSPSELAGCSDAFVESLEKDSATGKLVRTAQHLRKWNDKYMAQSAT